MIDLKNKKVLVMGLGLYEEGSGIAATKFLLSAGAKVTVTDLKTKEQLADQIKRLGASAKNIKWVLGCHHEADFKSADLIIKNPGVPRTSKFLKIVSTKKIPVYTDISLFFELFDRSRIIGITGTRGKSTTTTLIHELIKTVDRGAIIGGNIKKSPLLQLKSIKQRSVAILELSSWMLESLESIKKSPHIAVFTNIYPDHLNTYDGLSDYIEAKKNIFKFQTLQDYLVISRDNPSALKAGRKTPSQRYWFSKKYFAQENGVYIKNGWIYFRQNGREQKICSVKNVFLLGEHNLENVLAAVAVAMIFGVKPVVIKKLLGQFKGVADRLEFLREVSGVKYYNDTTSTTPEATMAALKALGKKKNIVLIAGGSDKGLKFGELAKLIKKSCREVVLLKGAGTDRLKRFLSSGVTYSEVASMAEAIGLAKTFAKRGEIVLLSPACASFGMFKNEFDRGDQFKKIIKSLK
jgi:UDP-N-acetylmuramoylalanine--D-glutamate ligase